MGETKYVQLQGIIGIMDTSRLQPLVVLIVCIVGIWAATTTHAPKEHSESESIGFVYNAATHSLIITTRLKYKVNCYVIALSDAERADVHNDAGMRSIELKYLAMLTIAKPTDFASLNHYDQRKCGHAPRNGTIHYF